MVEVANDLRKNFGADYIVESLYQKAVKKKKNCIIESIRSPLEAEALKRKDDFYLFAIDADPKVRYERNIKRGTETDNQSFKKFVSDEKREMTSTDPAKQNLKKCMQMADYKFDNIGTVEDLNKKVEEVIRIMLKKKMQNKKDKGTVKKTVKIEKYKRPSWDDYFLEVMNAIAKRATCDRGRAGTVIVKDRQILVTGYVGSSCRDATL